MLITIYLIPVVVIIIVLVEHSLSTQMDFTSSSRIYLSFFHSLGISVYQPESNGLSSEIFRYNLLAQATMSIIIGTWPVIDLLRADSQPDTVSTLEILVIYVSMALEVAQAMFFIDQYLHQKQLINDILGTFLKIESYFFIRLRRRISYGRFSQCCFYKTILVVCGIFQFALQYAAQWYYHGDPFLVIGILFRVSRFICAMVILQIVLFVDMLSYHLKELNLVIQQDSFNSKNGSIQNKSAHSVFMRDKIKCYKTVHFRLWTIGQKLNAHFDWILLVIMVKSFIDYLYSSFWIFDQLSWSMSYIRMYCEYLIIIYTH